MMIRNGQFKLILLFLFVSFIRNALAETTRPNIIIYETDDMPVNWQHPLLNMPNLRQFASEGKTLTHTYTNAVCSPSRWELFTGSNEVKGNFDAGKREVPDITLAKELKKLNYTTAIIGKYGFGRVLAQLPKWDLTIFTASHRMLMHIIYFQTGYKKIIKEYHYLKITKQAGAGVQRHQSLVAMRQTFFTENLFNL